MLPNTNTFFLYSILTLTFCKNHFQRGGTTGSKIEELSSLPHNGKHSKTQVGDDKNPSPKTLVTMEPDFIILKEPIDTETPNFLVAEIELPGISTQTEIMLDIGEDRLVCETKSNKHKYFMDIFLPYRLNQDECGAQFHREKHLLTVTMPLIC